MRIIKLFPQVAVFSMALLLSTAINGAENSPKFSEDFTTAKASAKKANKPLIVIFSASWCPPCQQMKRSVYPSKKVQPYHDSFVWAYLDADSEKNRPLMAQFGVKGIPHLAFLRPDGSMIGQFSGGVSASQFTEILDKVKVATKNPARSESKNTRGSSGKKGSGKKP